MTLLDGKNPIGSRKWSHFKEKLKSFRLKTKKGTFFLTVSFVPKHSNGSFLFFSILNSQIISFGSCFNKKPFKVFKFLVFPNGLFSTSGRAPNNSEASLANSKGHSTELLQYSDDSSLSFSFLVLWFSASSFLHNL